MLIEYFNVKVILHFWFSLCLVMVYNPFYMVLDSVFRFIFISVLMRKLGLWFFILVSPILFWRQVLFNFSAFLHIYIFDIKINIHSALYFFNLIYLQRSFHLEYTDLVCFFFKQLIGIPWYSCAKKYKIPIKGHLGCF